MNRDYLSEQREKALAAIPLSEADIAKPRRRFCCSCMSVLWQTELWDSRLLFQGFRQSAVRVQTTLRNICDSTATNQSWCNATFKTKENLLRNSHQWKRHEQESWLIRRFTAPAALTHNRKQLRISVSSFDFQSPFLTTKKRQHVWITMNFVQFPNPWISAKAASTTLCIGINSNPLTIQKIFAGRQQSWDMNTYRIEEKTEVPQKQNNNKNDREYRRPATTFLQNLNRQSEHVRQVQQQARRPADFTADDDDDVLQNLQNRDDYRLLQQQARPGAAAAGDDDGFANLESSRLSANATASTTWRCCCCRLRLRV